MESFANLALGALMLLTLAWLLGHPTKAQKERARTTQERRDWDWRA